MSISESVGVIWFEFAFYLLYVFSLYFVYIQSLWLYIVALIATFKCVRIIKRHLKRTVNIRGQGVFITGCDTGFGHDLAVRLDFSGFTVFAGCLYESGVGAKRLKSQCSKKLHVVPLDVSKDESVADALQYVQKHLPRPGMWAIVNNAGLNVQGDVELCTIKHYHKAMDINLYGYIRVIQTFLPLIRKTKGRIVNVSSVRGRISIPGDSAYIVTKHAIETMSDSLRLEMLKFGVKVSIIEPGNFSGVTGSCSPAQLLRYTEELNEMWECSSEDFKRVHTRQYIDTTLENLVRAIREAKGSAPSTAPVIDAMLDAIVNKEPKSRYLVPGGKGLLDFDRNVVLATVYGFLPTWMYDYIMVKMTGCDKVFPKINP